jgi:hypothetical protein
MAPIPVPPEVVEALELVEPAPREARLEPAGRRVKVAVPEPVEAIPMAQLARRAVDLPACGAPNRMRLSAITTIRKPADKAT